MKRYVQRLSDVCSGRVSDPSELIVVVVILYVVVAIVVVGIVVVIVCCCFCRCCYINTMLF